ncbi:MAG: hypothetical protein JWO73_945 [Candidatus Taylorbacteria bacterium]|nr:hypothetical protein [Candidatus Taylorbacteria bacterium]
MEDNARKFIVESIAFDFLKDHQATSFVLTVDWIETNEESEKKLAYKKFENDDIQILLISKITRDGNRVADKKKITEEEYRSSLAASILRLEKRRYEFKFAQNGIIFDMKYDEFTTGKLCLLEVDAPTAEQRALFTPTDFPFSVSEVTGDMRYYGYRVAEELRVR